MPLEWWHGWSPGACCSAGCRAGRGVFALMLIGAFFAELAITHETFSRWVIARIIEVKALEKITTDAKELA